MVEQTQDTGTRFSAYVDELVGVIGHKDRGRPLRDYCTGLLMATDRKSVEPLAAVTAPSRVAAQHQSLLHFVGEGGWSDDRVLSKVRELVLPRIERHGPIEAWILDDTGLPKKGRHSVGVARQYCGQLGKQDNCQVAVSLSLANGYASLPVAYRLYLPKEWSDDAVRLRKAGVPHDVGFRTKHEIALDHLRWACAVELPPAVVLMDAGYGNNTKLRAQVGELGLSYIADILSNATVWDPTQVSLPPKTWSGRGRPPTIPQADEQHRPVSVKQLAMGLPQQDWHKIAWREGSNDSLSSRFVRLRVCVARGDHKRRTRRRAEEWLMVEWPEGEREPTKYWLSSLPHDIGFEQMVYLAKLRWRIERDYLELKQEVGLGHFEGRGWRGFHHHATLCIAAYGFLICEREAIPPSAAIAAKGFPQPQIPSGYRPRGASTAARTARPQFDRNDPPQAHRRTHSSIAAMSVLCQETNVDHAST
jgi:SRSO17 transposase